MLISAETLRLLHSKAVYSAPTLCHSVFFWVDSGCGGCIAFPSSLRQMGMPTDCSSLQNFYVTALVLCRVTIT